MQNRVVCVPLVQPLQHHLRDTLGAAHNVRGVDRLVRWNQHEGFPRGIRAPPSAVLKVAKMLLWMPSIILCSTIGTCLYAAAWIHVWMAERGDDLAHALLVVRVAQQRHQLDAIAVAHVERAQLAFDFVEREFRDFEQHQARGASAMIWRHSSEPMEPPAPVTRMTLPRTQAPAAQVRAAPDRGPADRERRCP
jgi:hypothetical protein